MTRLTSVLDGFRSFFLPEIHRFSWDLFSQCTKDLASTRGGQGEKEVGLENEEGDFESKQGA